MKTSLVRTLHLLLGASLALTQTFDGSHSLRYFDIAISRPGLEEALYMTVGYVDDTEFVHFNGGAVNPRFEPRVPWMDQVGQEYWDHQTRIGKGAKQQIQEYFQNLQSYYNQSQNSSHTIQRMTGCYIGPNGHLLHAYRQFGYDGQDYLTLNEDLSTWTATDMAAEITKRNWETTNEAEFWRVYLQGTCVASLLKYLEMGNKTLLRTDPPRAHVTHHPRPEGDITLRCWAWSFYPAEIFLTWQRDGEEQTQEMEFVETRPSGDGTFQKWASLVVPSGEEHRYTCHVHHEGLPEPLTLRWSRTPQSFFHIVVAAVGLLFLGASLAAVVMWRKSSGGRSHRYAHASNNDGGEVQGGAEPDDNPSFSPISCGL
ncbi:class I histocompatibility antigen, Non-RT1.A alpha-1 chain-like [Microtus ochrogaster]|uniref:Class I histocompatibility antigen, Non-RT1.A alpha-1 chain-like n=1 Tax=Microtus ochrogaster TaxID=79684 RepID=A0ABM0L7K7_MICOH|nr:class I histocompatibility antigen, Non-RT1.A alpha-1 chain-like [Microtus ochrogaster]